MTRRHRTAVLLFNYGGPGSLAEVRPFLRSILADPFILDLPSALAPLRGALAWLIAAVRARGSRACYAAIGGRSPLNEETGKQARALAAALAGDGDFLVLPSMRYWPPRTDDAVRRALEAGATRFVLLPLYPQYSRTTTESSVLDFQRAAREAGAGHLPAHLVRGYHDHPDFIAAVAETIAAERDKLDPKERDRATLLFTAHGLPMRIVERGDPYPAEVEESVRCVVARLGWKGPARLSYQSKVGPVKWLEPFTEDVVLELSRNPSGPLLVYPIAFVSEHQETLYELDILYGDPARAAGLDYRRLRTAGCSPAFIECLRDVTLKALAAPPEGQQS
ncbi:MAG: ferrochelatase [Myxococcota bacterium]